MAKRFSRRRRIDFDHMPVMADTGKLLLRLSTGGLLLFHGINKITSGYSFISPMLERAGIPAIFAHGIIVGEVIAPILLILGIQVRAAALLQATVMIVAMVLVHSQEMLLLTRHGGYAPELPMLYLTASLAIFFLGAGRYRVQTSPFNH